MRQVLFVTGIGTGVGKTIASAILAEALHADYWKPVQAGDDVTDSEWVRQNTSSAVSIIHPESYLLKLPASPHIAAAEENKLIDIPSIVQQTPINDRNLIIEGPGGILVPLNADQFVIDLIAALKCKVILVSRNYLGSINHSLLTASICRQRNLPVAGWIFNDQYMNYEQEIVKWSGYPKISSIPFSNQPTRTFIMEQADRVKDNLARLYE